MQFNHSVPALIVVASVLLTCAAIPPTSSAANPRCTPLTSGACYCGEYLKPGAYNGYLTLHSGAEEVGCEAEADCDDIVFYQIEGTLDAHACNIDTYLGIEYYPNYATVCLADDGLAIEKVRICTAACSDGECVPDSCGAWDEDYAFDKCADCTVLGRWGCTA